jgi:PAS domain S-box-containing protein
LRIVARPLALATPDDDAMLVSFERLSAGEALQAQRPESAESIILHYESALKAAEDELHETINALSAANDHLLVSNQEFDAVNAELAASNSALASSKAELESLNAELSAVNAQLESNVGRLQAAHEDMANLLQSIDIATVFLTEALTVKRFTPAATRLFRLISSDVGRPISDIAACFDTARVEDDIAFAVERTQAKEREIRTHEGHWYIQRVTPYRRREGSIEGVVLSFIDVDELKRAEAELRLLSEGLEQTVQARTRQLSAEVQERRRAEEVLRSERNFVSAVLSTASALVMVLDAHGHIVRFNRACENASGYTFEEVAGQSLLDCQLFLGEDRVAAAHELLELRAGLHPKTAERRWRHRDGSVRLMSWVTSCLVDARGNVDYIIATGIDISEQRNAEDQARRRLAELTALHRLHTVGELGGIIAHELNQPLAAIAAHSEAATQRLRRATRTPETAMNDLKQISIQAQRAGSIIRNLRTFLAKGTGDSGPVDIGSVIGATCQLIVGEARTHHVVIVTDLAADLPLVTTEAVKIEHVLINLIRNGIEAIRDAGMKKGWIKIATVRLPDDMVRVTVVDSGPGLSTSLRDTLFEPFNSTKAEGLGLGLIISRSLIEQLGGRLWAEPTVSSGVFHFTLPFVP